jgi:hypothetical protein
MGLRLTWARGFAAWPSARSVHANAPFVTHEMYYTASMLVARNYNNQTTTHCAIKPRFIFEHVVGEAFTADLVATLICLRDRGHSLLKYTAQVVVQMCPGCVADLVVGRKVVPHVPIVEGCKLTGLRHDTKTVLDGRLDKVDLWSGPADVGAILVYGSRVVLAYRSLSIIATSTSSSNWTDLYMCSETDVDRGGKTRCGCNP